MCGIAGYVGPRAPGEAEVSAALESISHRGPDAAASRRFQTPDGRQVVLLHRRLRIIDLDPRANQPMSLGPITIVFNGELYNYLEVASTLQTELETSSDTEVLVAALAEAGNGVLDRCEGMWAFAAYNSRDGSLTLSRDRFGEKPLYLMDGPDDGLYFASEPKALFALAGRTAPVDHAQLRRFLVHGYKSLYKDVRRSFFEGVEQLEPATNLRIGAGGERRRERYWNPGPPQPVEMSFDEAVAGTRERLIRAVELRLRADVPLAFNLSGGVDSVGLISIARRELGEDVHGFTIVNSDARYEESEMVDLAVSELDLTHTKVAPSTDRFLERFRGLVRQHDAPVHTIAHYAHWLLQEAVHEHGYRVSVSGVAADELFTGYYDHHLLYLATIRADEDLYRRSAEAWREHVNPWVRNPYLQDADVFVADPDLRDHIYLDADRFSSWLVDSLTEGFAEEEYSGSLVRKRMLNELFHEAVPVILHEEDRNAMAYSIENRSPFLDRELFEFSTTIPDPLLIRDGRAKAVLRQALDGIAPTEIAMNRRKVGFNAPIFDFLDRSDPAVRAELLEDSPAFELVRRERIAELLDADQLPNSQSKFLFYFLGVKFFLEEFAA